MDEHEPLRRSFQFTIGHLFGLMLICSIGFVAIVAMFGPAPDESMLTDGDKKIIRELRNSGLNIRDQFT